MNRPLSSIPRQLTYRDFATLPQRTRPSWFDARVWLRDKPTLAMAVIAAAILGWAVVKMVLR